MSGGCYLLEKANIAPPNPLVGFKGPGGKEGKGKEREREKKRMKRTELNGRPLSPEINLRLRSCGGGGSNIIE